MALAASTVDRHEEEGIAERLAGELVEEAVALLGSVPGRVGALIEAGVERLTGGLGRAIDGLLGGSGGSSGGPEPAAFMPPAPPPPAPVSLVFSPGGLSLSGGTGSCGGAIEKLFHQFAVLTPFAAAVPVPEGEIVWLSREPLLPGISPRPPNGRPG